MNDDKNPTTKTIDTMLSLGSTEPPLVDPSDVLSDSVPRWLALLVPIPMPRGHTTEVMNGGRPSPGFPTDSLQWKVPCIIPEFSRSRLQCEQRRC